MAKKEVSKSKANSKAKGKRKSKPKAKAKSKRVVRTKAQPAAKAEPAQPVQEPWKLITPRDNWRNPIDVPPETIPILETIGSRLELVSTKDEKAKKFYLDTNIGGSKSKLVAPSTPNAPGQMSPHFHISEFHCNDGTPVPDWGVPRIKDLCNRVLEVIRKHPSLEGSSLRITSGFRSPSYNAMIGGAQYSQHPQCRAADIYAPELEAKYGTAEMVRRLVAAARASTASGIGVSYSDFVHVDIRPGGRVEW